MIYEWYTGSDESREVPRTISTLLRTDELEEKPSAAALTALLNLERDPNWRGYLLTRVALCLRDNEKPEAVVPMLEQAMACFDPLLPTMKEVFHEYALASYLLIHDKYFDNGDFEQVAALAIPIAMAPDAADLDPFVLSMLYAFLARALNHLGHRAKSSWLYRAAAAVYLRAHRISPDDPDFLSGLLNSYFNLRDVVACDAVLDMLREVDRGGRILAEAEEFARDRFGEIRATSGSGTTPS